MCFDAAYALAVGRSPWLVEEEAWSRRQGVEVLHKISKGRLIDFVGARRLSSTTEMPSPPALGGELLA